MEAHPSVFEAFRRLDEVAPSVPVLALGQTVFWDEPLKACLPILARNLGFERRFIAGVHDTDYFAKLPGGLVSKAPFVALPRNDGSTKGFWSAAGEFSALFGSETPVTREDLSKAGVVLERITGGDIAKVDAATEAWGWRGLASSDPTPPVVCELDIAGVFPYLRDTFRWALNSTLSCLCEFAQRAEGEQVADRLETLLCDMREACLGQTLAGFYECLLPELRSLVSGEPCKAEITRTSKLLRFTPESAGLARFAIVESFVNPKTAKLAADAYNEAVRGTEVYTLDRFGTGAIPFDLVIPCKGRGTIRLTPRVLIVMTRKPEFVNLESPVESVMDLARVVSASFGQCALVGKAITLISQLAAEYVFAFHETASMYVWQTRKLHNLLKAAGIIVRPFPILRIGHEAWDSLSATDRWFQVPQPLQRPFGAERVSAQTISRAWRCVIEKQKSDLEIIGAAKSPRQLIHALDKILGGRWQALADEYAAEGRALRPLRDKIARLKTKSSALCERLGAIKREWQKVEREMGAHFREKIIGRNPPASEMAIREGYQRRIQELREERREIRRLLADIAQAQSEAGSSPEVVAIRNRRKAIEREAEYARLQIVREAIISTKGLERANRRPSSWWLPVVSPDGAWFRRMLEKVHFRLEPLIGEAE